MNYVPNLPPGLIPRADKPSPVKRRPGMLATFIRNLRTKPQSPPTRWALTSFCAQEHYTRTKGGRHEHRS